MEKVGFRLEQDIKEDIHSQLLNDCDSLYSDGDQIHQIGNHEELLRGVLKNPPELLIDMFTKKLYINGRRATSKDLYSQSTTTEVLEILMKNQRREISNKELPENSYAK